MGNNPCYGCRAYNCTITKTINTRHVGKLNVLVCVKCNKLTDRKLIRKRIQFQKLRSEPHQYDISSSPLVLGKFEGYKLGRGWMS